MYITPDIQKVSYQCLQEDGEDRQFGNKAASSVDHQWAPVKEGLAMLESSRSPDRQGVCRLSSMFFPHQDPLITG